ncbi:MAG: sortase, partial [Candidatus Aminicenantes bacterium]|nr:sortase [Candidatus Aminicenantes bacterium]NIQ70422.1 sortase [Candidatus Aminicenantes bacterium]NIT26467.1 sortase [Candidatus Aminicenantes bacterium]
GSGIPGQEGNAVIYGHNKAHLFGPIRWLNEGEEIKIINQKGEEYIYSIVQTKTVTSETVAVLAPTETATLTLYTCTGFLDRERFVIVAQLQSE